MKNNKQKKIIGEPWIQPPSVLKITHHSQVKVMTGLNVENNDDQEEEKEEEKEEEEENQKEEQEE